MYRAAAQLLEMEADTRESWAMESNASLLAFLRNDVSIELLYKEYRSDSRQWQAMARNGEMLKGRTRTCLET